jgi:hypothetical protein
MVRTTSVLRGTGKTGRPSSQDMSAAGTLLEAGGLAPGAKGARVPVSREKMTVTDGPFTETKELTGGFAVLRARLNSISSPSQVACQREREDSHTPAAPESPGRLPPGENAALPPVYSR